MALAPVATGKPFLMAKRAMVRASASSFTSVKRPACKSAEQPILTLTPLMQRLQKLEAVLQAQVLMPSSPHSNNTPTQTDLLQNPLPTHIYIWKLTKIAAPRAATAASAPPSSSIDPLPLPSPTDLKAYIPPEGTSLNNLLDLFRPTIVNKEKKERFIKMLKTISRYNKETKTLHPI